MQPQDARAYNKRETISAWKTVLICLTGMCTQFVTDAIIEAEVPTTSTSRGHRFCGQWSLARSMHHQPRLQCRCDNDTMRMTSHRHKWTVRPQPIRPENKDRVTALR